MVPAGAHRASLHRRLVLGGLVAVRQEVPGERERERERESPELWDVVYEPQNTFLGAFFVQRLNYDPDLKKKIVFYTDKMN